MRSLSRRVTENLLTQDCLPFDKCHHPWYLMVVMIFGISYVVMIMYINEITKALKSLLIPRYSRII